MALTLDEQSGLRIRRRILVRLTACSVMGASLWILDLRPDSRSQERYHLYTKYFWSTISSGGGAKRVFRLEHCHDLPMCLSAFINSHLIQPFYPSELELQDKDGNLARLLVGDPRITLLPLTAGGMS